MLSSRWVSATPEPKLRTTPFAARKSVVSMTFTQKFVAIMRTLASLILVASIPFSGMDVRTLSGCGLFQSCADEHDSHPEGAAENDSDAEPGDPCSEHEGHSKDCGCADECAACGCTGPTLFVAPSASFRREDGFFERGTQPSGPPTHASDGASPTLFRPPIQAPDLVKLLV